MATTLRFDGPSAYLYPEGRDGPRVRRGETFTCSDERAIEHLTSPSYDCSEVTRSRQTRAELDEIAAQRGIDPSAYRTKADLESALNESEAAPSGEGDQSAT